MIFNLFIVSLIFYCNSFFYSIKALIVKKMGLPTNERYLINTNIMYIASAAETKKWKKFIRIDIACEIYLRPRVYTCMYTYSNGSR